MRIMKKLGFAFTHMRETAIFLLSKLHWISDEQYLKIKYRLSMGEKLNLEDPQTYNEKLQWLKLHYRNPRYTELVDKYTVKAYVSSTIGAEYVIPTLGVWSSVEEIDFDQLPDRYVLKCTHDSGSVVICRDKHSFDINAAKQRVRKKLKKNMYWWGREWQYKNITPRIIAEEYMEDATTRELRDYKFFCFDGVVRVLFVATDRMVPNTEVKFDFFDPDYHHIDMRQGHPNAKSIPEKPLNFELMKELAARLSIGFPHVRVDFYEVNGKVYFGEMTFTNMNGVIPFSPKKWDSVFGEWIKLPKKEK